MKKILVIYHRADFDGLFCREIARKFLGDMAEYVGWNHGDAKVAFPTKGTVYILDLSPECLGGDTYDSSRIIWIDHHKSSIEKWPATIPGLRIDGVAACRLAWQWFTLPVSRKLSPYPKEDYVERRVVEPPAVRLAGEYDIWDKRDPRAELFQHGLRSCDLTNWWPSLLDDTLTSEQPILQLLSRGEAIQYSSTQLNASIIQAYGFTVQWEGLTFLACNHARFNSHLFTAGIQPHHDALLGFNFDGQKGVWRFSLYHAPGHEQHDLSAIAVKYGGGGHRGACGFRCGSIPFGFANMGFKV